MMNLLAEIKKLKNSPVKKLVNSRISEFKSKKTDEELFSELCFCIMTAGFRADKSIEIQKKIGNGFLTFSKPKLQQKLKEFGYRYHNRASYIVLNRKHAHDLRNRDREWLVKNIKGLGMKEASHFLRNIGRCDCAIIDFHIIDILAKYKLIKKPKSLTKAKYLEIEKVLENIAKKAKLTLDELDLYLWYLETGKILK
jgi:N-glycosylase/DNA lyase